VVIGGYDLPMNHQFIALVAIRNFIPRKKYQTNLIIHKKSISMFYVNILINFLIIFLVRSIEGVLVKIGWDGMYKKLPALNSFYS
jgi:hypothetical protein